MSTTFNSLVNRHEAETLKEMIFKRVQERSKNLSNDVQDELMSGARSSFVTKENPFAKILNTEVNNVEFEEFENPEKLSNNEEIGFEQKNIKPNFDVEKKVLKTADSSNYSVKEIMLNMQDARTELQSKTSFMGALNFLNSQAAVSLLRKKSEKFDILV